MGQLFRLSSPFNPLGLDIHFRNSKSPPQRASLRVFHEYLVPTLKAPPPKTERRGNMPFKITNFPFIQHNPRSVRLENFQPKDPKPNRFYNNVAESCRGSRFLIKNTHISFLPHKVHRSSQGEAVNNATQGFVIFYPVQVIGKGRPTTRQRPPGGEFADFRPNNTRVATFKKQVFEAVRDQVTQGTFAFSNFLPTLDELMGSKLTKEGQP
ncbi:hypothetical protein L1987_61380 [Smallanthus sonchifolius]|uniref:Uncharacterized protein n=1 Tax=Smallanthus sonchifolius TaxID=185202 RepID=A0ACB9C7G1_9ASTR|nr:hypothetical protein L1987_61380 [Smallanthus sonchifolius]